jgi:hypothetical protein
MTRTATDCDGAEGLVNQVAGDSADTGTQKRPTDSGFRGFAKKNPGSTTNRGACGGSPSRTGAGATGRHGKYKHNNRQNNKNAKSRTPVFFEHNSSLSFWNLYGFFKFFLSLYSFCIIPF